MLLVPRFAVRPVLRRLAAAALLLAAACGSGASRPVSADAPPREPVPFRRVGEGALYIAEPGVLVIGDAASWRALWQRFNRDGVPVPAVDFSRERVLAVSGGETSGCSNAARYVWRVERGRDSLFVAVGHDDHPSPLPQVTCDMLVAPVDLVVLPRGGGPVLFTGPGGGSSSPPPARWLQPAAAP